MLKDDSHLGSLFMRLSIEIRIDIYERVLQRQS